MGLKARQWVILLIFYTSYLIFGAGVFYHIEHAAETERRAKELQKRIDINELLVAFTSPDDLKVQRYILDRLSTYCNKPVTNHTDDEFIPPYQWTFYHSVFFAFIVCSTLGYGNITPSGTVGRFFVIFYALIGMPLNMILYTYLGEFFGTGFIKVYDKYKSYKLANNRNYAPGRWSLIGQITLVLTPATAILIFLPSCIFTYFEGWPYSVSVYYSFITLTTIGFGDFVPTFQPDQEQKFGIYFTFYQIFVLLWFIFGLSYILMLIGFIARGMQSKKIVRLEQQLTDNIKLTHNRIWNEVSKDVGYLRRIFNEVYIMRFRPVFNEPTDVNFNTKLNRSQSCPNISIYQCMSPVARRKRAYSEICFSDEISNQRPEIKPLQGFSRHSETNLLFIDKEKTFQQQNILDNTGDILAQVVMALNTFNQNEPNDGSSGGIDLFSEKSILNDEWSVVEAQKPPETLRCRSKSLYPSQINHVITNELLSTPQFTWSCNNNDIQDYVNAQARSNTTKMDTDQNVMIDIKSKEPETAPLNRRKSIFNAFNNVFKRRATMANIDDSEAAANIPDSKSIIKSALSPNTERKLNPDRRPQFDLSVIRRQSIVSNQSTSSEQILENTTIADLIRAIETAHVKNLLGDINFDTKPNNFPSNRRLSLIPPKRQDSFVFNSNNSTSTTLESNQIPFPMRRSSLAMPQNRNFTTIRQHSSPNRFSVTLVSDSPRSTISLSPIVQRRMRRFSAVPASFAVMPSKVFNSSVQTTPHVTRRNQFKSIISPLAVNNSYSPTSKTLNSVEEPDNE